jgi:hypothetical protein
MVKIGKNVGVVKVVPSMTTLSFFEAKLALRRFREGRRWSPNQPKKAGAGPGLPIFQLDGFALTIKGCNFRIPTDIIL